MTAPTWTTQPPIAGPPDPPPRKPTAGITAVGERRQRRPSPAGIMWAKVKERPAGRRYVFAALAVVVAFFAVRAMITSATDHRFDKLEADLGNELGGTIAAEFDARETQLRADIGAEITAQVDAARTGIAPTVIAQDPLGNLPCTLSANAQVFIGLNAGGQPNAERAQAIRQQLDPLLAAGVPYGRIGIGAPADNAAAIRVVDILAEPNFGAVALVACPAPGS